MPRLKNKNPKLCINPRGQAYVRLSGQTYWLGSADDPKSETLYNELLGQWIAGGRQAPPDVIDDADDSTVVTVTEVALRYWQHARVRTPTKHNCIRQAMRTLRELYGSTPANAFGPKRLRLVRDRMVARDLTRIYINEQIAWIVRAFKWAGSHELISPSIYRHLQSLDNLKAGDGGRDSRNVTPVPRGHVRKIWPHLSTPVRGLVLLQRLTGARPGELINLRAIDIDINGDVWKTKLAKHKNTHRGKKRTLYFSPRAQRVLATFMRADRPVDAPLFSPKEAYREMMQRHATKGQRRRPNQKPNPRNTERTIGDAYCSEAYAKAISRACDRVWPLPEELQRGRIPGKRGGRIETEKEWRQRLGAKWQQVLDHRRANHWTPNQLRHEAATRLRARFGLELAALVLGHSSAVVTDAVYAERDERKILKVMRKSG